MNNYTRTINVAAVNSHDSNMAWGVLKQCGQRSVDVLRPAVNNDKHDGCTGYRIRTLIHPSTQVRCDNKGWGHRERITISGVFYQPPRLSDLLSKLV
jgi:hypothetical protein